jgi:hypothetical protein
VDSIAAKYMVVHNYGGDHGWAGDGFVLVHRDPALCEYGFSRHEMGHGHGLPHSFAANPDFEYGDGWDVMSFAATTFQFPITFNATAGSATVGLNARNLEALGPVPAGRSWTAPGPDFSATVTLDPLRQALLGSHGELVVRIPPWATSPARPSESTFLVEFHRNTGWDQQSRRARCQRVRCGPMGSTTCNPASGSGRRRDSNTRRRGRRLAGGPPLHEAYGHAGQPIRFAAWACRRPVKGSTHLPDQAVW